MDDSHAISAALSDEAMKHLHAFSDSANKNMGSSHPMDSRRWAAFAIVAHLHEADLDVAILKDWLLKQGWTEDRARDLVIEYGDARRLLSLYDKALQEIRDARKLDEAQPQGSPLH